MLNKVHEGHQGIKNALKVPGSLSCGQVFRGILKTKDKSKAELQRAQPKMPSSLSDLPWQKVGTDHLMKRKYILAHNRPLFTLY